MSLGTTGTPFCSADCASCGLDFEDRPREECGVVGIASASPDAAATAFFGLFALQHRGQEAAGIAASDGTSIRLHKEAGLVSQVFREGTIGPLAGSLAIGHTRYSTTGSPAARNAQPFVFDTMHGPLAMAHNGNLTNATALRGRLLERGFGLTSASDSEVMAMMLAGSRGDSWADRIASAASEWEGAFSIVALTRDAVLAARDPWGFRPLAVGDLPGGGWAAASETCALHTLGCRAIRDLDPGEIVQLSARGLESARRLEPRRRASCTFEFIYFSRPDSEWNGSSVHRVREAFGRVLAEESPVKADLVIAVPDSSISAAIGFAARSGKPYGEGFVKNRYIGRTFIEPTQALRRQGVAMKFNVLAENVRGRALAVIDDSIVRGTTTGPLVALLRSAGAREVHVRIASPPILHPCFMGVDMGRADELAARRVPRGGMASAFGADSLEYLSIGGMMAAIGEREGYCNACFTGEYPVCVDAIHAKGVFEGALR
jgi:amidophosphoribosyltransferase